MTWRTCSRNNAVSEHSVLSKMARAIEPEWWRRYDRIMATGSDEMKRSWKPHAELALRKAQAALDASGVVSLLREAMESRAPDFADAAHPGWSDRARDFLTALSPSGEG